MPESNPDLCEKCGTRPASIHLCDGSAGTSRSLCQECLAQENSLASAWCEEAKSATCEYCGGSPCGGGMDTLGQIIGAQLRVQWLCSSCSMEYHAHQLAEMNQLPDGLPRDEQIKALKRIADETRSHMRRFVAMRAN